MTIHNNNYYYVCVLTWQNCCYIIICQILLTVIADIIGQNEANPPA